MADDEATTEACTATTMVIDLTQDKSKKYVSFYKSVAADVYNGSYEAVQGSRRPNARHKDQEATALLGGIMMETAKEIPQALFMLSAHKEKLRHSQRHKLLCANPLPRISFPGQKRELVYIPPLHTTETNLLFL